MDSSVSPKDAIWFLRVCHHVSTGLYALLRMLYIYNLEKRGTFGVPNLILKETATDVLKNHKPVTVPGKPERTGSFAPVKLNLLSVCNQLQPFPAKSRSKCIWGIIAWQEGRSFPTCSSGQTLSQGICRGGGQVDANILTITSAKYHARNL